MKRYLKKPIPVEARQYNSTNLEDIVAWGEGKIEHFHGLRITTLEGVMSPSVGDYVVKGPMGEFWFIRKEIFEATYEEL